MRTAGQAAGDARNKDKDKDKYNGNGNGSERGNTGNAPEIPDPVLVPGFDREIEEPVPGAMSIPASANIVVVEGNYLLMQSGGWQEVVPLLDVSFFVDLERGIRLERLIARHERFGKSPDAARDWALGPDEANARLIEESAARATHRIRRHEPREDVRLAEVTQAPAHQRNDADEGGVFQHVELRGKSKRQDAASE